MKLDRDTLTSCRERSGAAADARPDRIDDALESEKLGYGEGEPLAADSYDSYPSRSELSNPSQGGFLRELLTHPKVNDVGDAVAELTGATDTPTLRDWIRTVESAAEINNLDIDSLTAEGSADEGGADPLTVTLGYKPHDSVVSSDSTLLVAELYAEGLSVSEISEILDTDGPHVRDTLKDVGLIEGKTRAETRSDFAENDARLGGTTIDNTDTGDSRGLTVNADDYA